MKLLAILAAVLGLAGCEHMYAAGDLGLSDAPAQRMFRTN